MQNELQEYVNDAIGTEIRVVMQDGDPWFVAKDICKCLGIGSTGRAVNGNSTRGDDGLDDDEKGVYNVHTLGGKQKLTIISESGVYFLISKSRKKKAKDFRRWLRKDVLTSINKHGLYGTPTTIDKIIEDPAAFLKLASAIQYEREEKEFLQDKESVFGNVTPYGAKSKHNGKPRTYPRKACLVAHPTKINDDPKIKQLTFCEAWNIPELEQETQ